MKPLNSPKFQQQHQPEQKRYCTQQRPHSKRRLCSNHSSTSAKPLQRTSEGQHKAQHHKGTCQEQRTSWSQQEQRKKDMFTSGFVLPFVVKQKPSFFSHDFNKFKSYCPYCCCASLECLQGLPQLISQVASQRLTVICSCTPNQSTIKKIVVPCCMAQCPRGQP